MQLVSDGRTQNGCQNVKPQTRLTWVSCRFQITLIPGFHVQFLGLKVNSEQITTDFLFQLADKFKKIN